MVQPRLLSNQHLPTAMPRATGQPQMAMLQATLLMAAVHDARWQFPLLLFQHKGRQAGACSGFLSIDLDLHVQVVTSLRW